jgi:DNA-binding NtrC family response regulator
MAGEKVRILVVDDEEIIRHLFQRTLEEAGYNVVTAANGEEALQEVNKSEPEMVLLDIRMPGLSGMEVLSKLTNDYPNICVIMVTAVGDTKTAVEAMKLGAYDYITKPAQAKDVVRRVQKALEKRDLNLQREQFLIELQQSLGEKSKQMQEQFDELVRTLAREHTLLYELTKKQQGSGKAILSRLPPELQKPMSSVEEFRDALLRILKREKL